MKCLLCQGNVKTLNRYLDHLTQEHELSSGREIVMSTTFLSQMEKDILMARVEHRKKQFVEEKIFKTNGNIFNIDQDQTVEAAEDLLLCSSKSNTSNKTINETVKNQQPVSKQFINDQDSLLSVIGDEDQIDDTEMFSQIPAEEESIDERPVVVNNSNQNTKSVDRVEEDPGCDVETSISSSCSNNEDLECRLCFTFMYSKGNLSRHMRNVHKNDQHLLSNATQSTFSCSWCPYSTQTEYLLQIHMKRNHPEDRSSKLMEQKTEMDNNNRLKCKIDDDSISGRSSNVITVIKTETLEYFDINNESDEKSAFGMTNLNDDPKYSSKLMAVEIDEELVRDYTYTTPKVINVQSLASNSENFGGNEFICNLCYFGFSSASDLDNHQNYLHKDDLKELEKKLCVDNLIYPCDICDLKFLTENIVTVHRKLQHRLKPRLSARRGLYCVLCKVKFERQKYLDHHIKSYHSSGTDSLKYHSLNSKLIHNCNICGESFYTERFFAFHSNVVHKDDDAHCELCSLKFKTAKGLLIHKTIIHKDELIAFTRKYEANDLVHKCHFCVKHFPTQGSVQYHMNRKHCILLRSEPSLNNQKFPEQGRHCNLCVVNFKSSKGLELHKKKVHQSELDAFNTTLTTEDLRHQCNECSLWFYSLNSLKCHKIYIHNESKCYCNLCHVTFKRRSYYSAHMKNVHKSENFEADVGLDLNGVRDSNKCRYCDKTFHKEKYMNYHLKYAHKGTVSKTDSTCKYCKKEFKAGKNKNSNIKKHMRIVHNFNGSDEKVSSEQNVHKNYLALLNSQSSLRN